MSSLFTANPHARPQDARAFRRMFVPGRLTLGVFFPIEAFKGDQPAMREQEKLAQRAEQLGFAALWVRDVPLRDPTFGDTGQVYDPWVWLGWIAAHTSRIALATGSIVLPLRHPLHTAKAAASVDRLTGARLVLGVASGDRPVEFPAFGVDFERRAEHFRENLLMLRAVLESEFPVLRSSYGVLGGQADLVPKPIGRIPMLVTGHAGQSLEWIARHSDGWITYPRSLVRQVDVVRHWRASVARAGDAEYKPFVQSFYVDLAADPRAPAAPIHLGLRGGRDVVRGFLEALQEIGVSHVILNLKYGSRESAEVLEELGTEVMPRLGAAAPKEETA
ncbi:MAG TPA: LLM class oxidoreductase [Usitatibacter sp.]|nr:LLM class oxidoreductase [Usitatibacter sp.]